MATLCRPLTFYRLTCVFSSVSLKTTGNFKTIFGICRGLTNGSELSPTFTFVSSNDKLQNLGVVNLNLAKNLPQGVVGRPEATRQIW